MAIGAHGFLWILRHYQGSLEISGIDTLRVEIDACAMVDLSCLVNFIVFLDELVGVCLIVAKLRDLDLQMMLLLVGLWGWVNFLLPIGYFLLSDMLLKAPWAVVLTSLIITQPESFALEHRHVFWALAAVPRRTLLLRGTRRVLHVGRLLVDALTRGAIALTLLDGDHWLEVQCTVCLP